MNASWLSPPSTRTITSYPPLCGQTWHSATSIQYRVVTETVLRALRDLRAPWWPGMPSLASCVRQEIDNAPMQSEEPAAPGAGPPGSAEPALITPTTQHTQQSPGMPVSPLPSSPAPPP